MDRVAATVVDILKKNMPSPPETLSLDTPLDDLGLQSLDIAVIAFDIEDAFAIELPYRENEDIEDFSTVGSIVDAVRHILDTPAEAA